MKNLPIGTGGSSILIMFVLIAITALAALSLTTALANYRLALRLAQASVMYYEADSAAEEILARISALIRENNLNIDNLSELTDDFTFHENILSYNVLIDQTRYLQVELKINEQGFTITKWRVVSLPREEEQQGLPIWQ